MSDCCDVDALGRHDALCERAVSLGLPRRAEGEEPLGESVEEDLAVEDAPEPEPLDGGEVSSPGWIDWQRLCVACGEPHIRRGDPYVAVGKSRVAETCRWTLDWPGKQAHEVIDVLQTALGVDALIKLRDEVQEAGS